MTMFRLHGCEYPIPGSAGELNDIVGRIAQHHQMLGQRTLLVAFSADHGGRPMWGAVTAASGAGLHHLLFETLGRPELGPGFVQARLSNEQVGELLAPFGPYPLEWRGEGVKHLLAEAYTNRRAVTAFLVLATPPDGEGANDYIRLRTSLLFDLFNAGALRGSDPAARQALLDSFAILPNRFLSEGGQFIVPLQEDAVFSRRVKSFTEWSGPIAEIAPGGIDKFPSLMSIRANELLLDGNRIVPGAMIRDGVYVGKRNIFMFHVAVNIAAYIGDDNLIDSHASIASSAQIGNKNKIGSFVSIEGVLSPANAEPVVIGDENFFGTFVRIGTGIRVGNRNFIGAGVNLSLGTKLKDCRGDSPTRGEYIAVREINDRFNDLAITPNNAVRNFEGVELVPGEYVLFANSPDFMARFEGDIRIRGKA